MKNSLQQAVAKINNGGVVAYPTETVYGLACDAMDQAAIKKIFDLKQRPLDIPLTLNIASIEDMSKYAINIPKDAIKLAKIFWPGPLTIVLEKSDLVNALVSANTKTVGLRIPRHPVTLEFLRQLGKAIVGPSANLHGQTGAKTAAEVKQVFQDNVYLLDGGSCELGIASTVIDFTKQVPTIIRHGAIKAAQIAQILEKPINSN